MSRHLICCLVFFLTVMAVITADDDACAEDVALTTAAPASSEDVEAGSVSLVLSAGQPRPLDLGVGVQVHRLVALRAHGSGLVAGYGLPLGRASMDGSLGGRWGWGGGLRINLGLALDLTLDMNDSQRLIFSGGAGYVNASLFTFCTTSLPGACSPEHGYSLDLSAGWSWLDQGTEYRLNGGMTFFDMAMNEQNERQFAEYVILPQLAFSVHWWWS